MSKLDKVAILTKVNNYISSNGNNQITGLQVREVFTDILDSYPNTTSESHLLGLKDYMTTVAYVSGNTVVYGGTIYVATASTQGAFDASKWREVPAATTKFNFPDYNNSTTYVANDIVEYNLRLYKNILTVQGTPPPNATYWVELYANNGNFGNVWQAGYYNFKDVVRHNDKLYECTVNPTLNSANIGTEIGEDKWKEISESGDLSAYALLASPAFTGTPTAPTAVLGTDTTQIATTEFVQNAIEALINSSPGALDTLNELAAALGNDANFASTVTTALAAKEPTIIAGSTSQYWRGDKTWQTHNLDSLSDVVITTPATGDIVRYNGTNFVNTTLSAAGILAGSGTTGRLGKFTASGTMGNSVVFAETDSTADYVTLIHNSTLGNATSIRGSGGNVRMDMGNNSNHQFLVSTDNHAFATGYFFLGQNGFNLMYNSETMGVNIEAASGTIDLFVDNTTSNASLTLSNTDGILLNSVIEIEMVAPIVYVNGVLHVGATGTPSGAHKFYMLSNNDFMEIDNGNDLVLRFGQNAFIVGNTTTSNEGMNATFYTKAAANNVAGFVINTYENSASKIFKYTGAGNIIIGSNGDPTEKLDVHGNVKFGAASGVSGSRIVGRGEHTSAPATALSTGEWEMSLYDDNTTPYFTVRYKDGSVTKYGEFPVDDVATVDWRNGIFNDYSAVQSIGFKGRELYHSGTATVVDWGNGILYDWDNNFTLNWFSGAISRGAYVIMDWDTTELLDVNGNLSANWTSRELYDEDEEPSLAFGTRELKDAAGTSVFNWESWEFQSTVKALKVPVMTATQASVLTISDGIVVNVTTTNGTFTAKGFWGVEDGIWVKM